MDKSKKVILIKDDKLGSGDLGAMMMGGFLGAVGAQADLLPKSVVLLNRGVLLGAKEAENSGALEALKALESQGVEVLFCQTCVEFFEVDARLGVGRVSNAMEISRLLLSHEVLSL